MVGIFRTDGKREAHRARAGVPGSGLITDLVVGGKRAGLGAFERLKHSCRRRFAKPHKVAEQSTRPTAVRLFKPTVEGKWARLGCGREKRVSGLSPSKKPEGLPRNRGPHCGREWCQGSSRSRDFKRPAKSYAYPYIANLVLSSRRGREGTSYVRTVRNAVSRPVRSCGGVLHLFKHHIVSARPCWDHSLA